MQSNQNAIRATEREAYALADSKHADMVKDLLDFSVVDNAEHEFSKLLKLIPDKALRDKLDKAAGRISSAYEKLGFAEGFVTDRLFYIDL